MRIFHSLVLFLALSANTTAEENRDTSSVVVNELIAKVTGVTLIEYIELKKDKASEYGISFSSIERLDGLTRLYVDIPNEINNGKFEGVDVDFYCGEKLVLNLKLYNLNERIKYNKLQINRFHFKFSFSDNNVYGIWIKG